jgi:glycerol-3-phosphate acyltransferase PlsY
LGSGSAGSTNTGRFLPKKVKYLVFILDALKGVIPVLIIYGVQSTLFKDYLIKTVYFDSFLLSYIAGLFGIIGHCFPIFFKFKGGKGIASFFGLICMLSILITIGGCIV